MGKITGIWNRQPTPYDDLPYDEYMIINRLTNFEAWALLNQQQQPGWNVLAPDGIVYCSAPCALIENFEHGWGEEDLEPISGEEFSELYAGEGINPWCVDRCPHCGLSYRRIDHRPWSKRRKERIRLDQRDRVQMYLAQRKSMWDYPSGYPHSPEPERIDRKDKKKKRISRNVSVLHQFTEEMLRSLPEFVAVQARTYLGAREQAKLDVREVTVPRSQVETPPMFRTGSYASYWVKGAMYWIEENPSVTIPTPVAPSNTLPEAWSHIDMFALLWEASRDDTTDYMVIYCVDLI